MAKKPKEGSAAEEATESAAYEAKEDKPIHAHMVTPPAKKGRGNHSVKLGG